MFGPGVGGDLFLEDGKFRRQDEMPGFEDPLTQASNSSRSS